MFKYQLLRLARSNTVVCLFIIGIVLSLMAGIGFAQSSPDLVLANEDLSSGTYNFTTYGTMATQTSFIVESGATVTLRAGTSISLNPGTTINSGSTFHAYIDSSQSYPVVSLAQPVNGASFLAPGPITLTAAASDSSSGISKVEFFDGSVKIGESSSSPYNFTWNNVNVGIHTLHAAATNNQAAVSTSASIAITVNDTPAGALPLSKEFIYLGGKLVAIEEPGN